MDFAELGKFGSSILKVTPKDVTDVIVLTILELGLGETLDS